MNKRIIIILLIVTMLVSAGSIAKIVKKDIHSATIEELVELNDIGFILANRIMIHISCYENCSVDDLISVDGIGCERLKEIKKYYY